MKKTKKTALPKFETELAALDEDDKFGEVKTVKCERCSQLLVVSKLGKTAWKVSCPCGLYDDTLKGF
jgi:hypothetical protein